MSNYTDNLPFVHPFSKYLLNIYCVLGSWEPWIEVETAWEAHSTRGEMVKKEYCDFRNLKTLSSFLGQEWGV